MRFFKIGRWNKHARENVVFVLISMAFFMHEPALAQENQNPYNPINFTQTLNLSRGSLSPSSPDAVYLNADESCRLMQEVNGWRKESCRVLENVIVSYLPGVESLIVEKPNAEGYVKFDDWDTDEKNAQIEKIWDQLVISTKEQGKRTGETIFPVKWVVYPTLNKDKSYMYYAFMLDWAGEKVVNVKASLFDRRGYIPFRFVPVATDLSENELTRLVETTLASYMPAKSESYFDFHDGDKVAAAGALGVLATLVGVKYGKAVAGGALAVILLLAKKLWFLIFLPFAFFKKLFGRKKNSEA